jgi:hypothetical protein
MANISRITPKLFVPYVSLTTGEIPAPSDCTDQVTTTRPHLWLSTSMLCCPCNNYGRNSGPPAASLDGAERLGKPSTGILWASVAKGSEPRFCSAKPGGRKHLVINHNWTRRNYCPT